ncbi:MAG: 50S ribosomal protein L4 [Planctomycetia bacterium]|nr:50S ribosomal protein L4 [Planctomycetia bacterium]
MIEVPLTSVGGGKSGTFEVDEAWFGGRVNKELLHRAIIAYEANRHAGTAATKSRGMIVGSTRKIFRQKGTGRARMGTVRSPIRRGGGVTFAKRARSMRRGMPKAARRAALDSALLAKFLDGEVIVVEGLEISEPRTRQIADLLEALKVTGRRCLLAIKEPCEVLWKSARNIPRLAVMPAADLNAYEVIRATHILVLRDAMDALVEVRKN